MRGHRIWAEIRLDAMRHNLGIVRSHLDPATRILAVVKADAYGHGAVPVARCALQAGCTMLGVGDSTEALELRESGIAQPVLILGAIVEEEIPRVLEHDIGVTVHSPDLLSRLQTEARRRGKLLRVHLKIDTGMGRLGVSPRSAVSLARKILSYPNLDLEGVCTHFATREAAFSRRQLALFRGALARLADAGVRPPWVHAANSVGLFQLPESHFNLVRPGIALYGMDPGELAEFDLRPMFSLYTRTAFLKWVPAGTGIGYNRTFVTTRRTRIATCPVGYNDGYPHLLSNRGHAVLRGRRVPVVGTVTMDYIMLDVTDVPGASIGDVVTLMGDEIRVEELAGQIRTIPYALPCGMGKRVRRIYVGEDAPARRRSRPREAAG